MVHFGITVSKPPVVYFMGTSNPKVSAYVPQPIKDRLTKFREQQNLSESQAVTTILAEYFQMEQPTNSSGKVGQVGGVTLGRMERLEERLANFAASVDHRLQQLEEEISRIGGLSVVHQMIPDEIISEGKQSDSLPSEPQVVEKVIEKADELLTGNQEPEQVAIVSEAKVSSLPVELPSEPQNQADEAEKPEAPEVEQVVIVSEVKVSSLPIELPSEPQNQIGDEGEKLEVSQEVDNSVPPSELLNHSSQESEEQVLVEKNIIDSSESKPEFSLLSEPLDNLISKPLPGKIMAKRLGYHPDSLSKVKTKATDEEFLSLSADKDPDGIAWKFAKKGRGYLLANELSSELQNRLLNWLKENFPEYQS